MTRRKTTNTELAAEVKLWETGKLDPGEWTDAPDSVVRAGESESISLRMPKKLLAILKELARREGVGYQVLIKQWLDDRVRSEFAKLGGEGRKPKDDAIGQLQRQFKVLEGRLTEVEKDLRKQT